MKYEVEVDIALPRDRVIELFDSTENLYQWQEGLQSFEHLEGEAGQVGARSKLVYDSRRGALEMVETITKRNLPHEFSATYTTRGVYNEVDNSFEVRSPDSTRWKMSTIFKFKGMMALMAPFMTSAFKSNTRLSMERFKAFAEGSK